MWKTTFKNFEGIWSAKADHIPSNFLKVVFHKYYLVHSWILCPIWSKRLHPKKRKHSKIIIQTARERDKICSIFILKTPKWRQCYSGIFIYFEQSSHSSNTVILLWTCFYWPNQSRTQPCQTSIMELFAKIVNGLSQWMFLQTDFPP